MSLEPLETLAGDLDCILDELLQQGPGGEVGPGLGLVHWSNSNQPPMQSMESMLLVRLTLVLVECRGGTGRGPIPYAAMIRQPGATFWTIPMHEESNDDDMSMIFCILTD